MESNHLSTIEISGFKKLSNLKVNDIGQFNLIVGDNNVGKSSLLEALCANKDLNLFYKSLGSILTHVKKYKDLKNGILDQYFSFSSSAYPQTLLIKLVTNKNPEKDCYIRLKKSSSHNASGISYPVTTMIDDDFPGQNINVNYNKDRFDLDIPFVPFGSLYQHELTEEYSKYIQLFIDKKDHFIQAISNILPDIRNIEVNSSYSFNPILLIAENKKNVLLPLATYGDGTIKLFRILISLFANNYNYNRLMIDEIDSGIYYENLKGFIKSLLTVAKNEKKQIFATTHSKECIQAFKDALEENDIRDDGRIIRLSDTKKGIQAFTMKFEEFENALFAESEIR